jgi:hypothetical protein
MSDPGWHPDPFGRSDYRYFDGTEWTDKVSTAGVESTDPPAVTPPPPPTAPDATVQPGTPPPPTAPDATVQQGAPPPPTGHIPPPPGNTAGSGGKRNIVPFLIAGGVGLLVLVLLIVLIGGGGDGDGGGGGTGTETFVLEGERATFSKTFDVDQGQGFRVRVEPESGWDPVIVLSADEGDFAGAIRANGDLLSDISALSGIDLDEDDREILDSLALSDDLEDTVSDSGDLPEDQGRQVVLERVDDGFEGEAEALSDISFFGTELRITVYDYEGSKSDDRSGQIIIETTDETLDSGDFADTVSDGDLPDAFSDFLSDDSFLSP